MLKLITRLLTKNYKKVPLFYTYLDYSKYKKTQSKDNTITCKVNPIFSDDEYLQIKFKEIADHIKEYDYDKII